MSFHENLKKLRRINNMSQERFAELLSISRQAVAKYESGKCYPDVEKLILISNLFNVSLDDLLKVKKSIICRGEARGRNSIKTMFS